MSQGFVAHAHLANFRLWDKLKDQSIPVSFDLELTARCNNDCRHCYINLPAGDRAAQAKELSLGEITRIASEAAASGAVWCLITGGEPLLRADFTDIYVILKRLGLLVSVFTNACLVTSEHISLFKQYPPRDIEVTVYGVTAETYERVTRRPGSFAAFRRGLDSLFENNIPVRLKAMALRSNRDELPAIGRFCRERTKDYYRLDPLLHLRYDGSAKRNQEILSERLNPEEIVAIEHADQEHLQALKKQCSLLLHADSASSDCRHLFHCGVGKSHFVVGYDARLRLCSSLWHPDCLYDLREGSCRDALDKLIPSVREMRSTDEQFLQTCHDCPLINLCLWCPAHSYLETGRMDARIPYFCQVAHVRAETLKRST